jgi:hypothetical protein
LDTYSYKVASQQAEEAYFNIPKMDVGSASSDCHSATLSQPSVPSVKPLSSKAGRSLRSIGVVILEIVKGGGGHRKILRFCHDWAHEGIKVTLYVDTKDHPNKILSDVHNYFYRFPFEPRTFKGPLDAHDAYVCTHWSTAYAMRGFKEPSKVLYFVQDFEAMFEPVSTNYVKALSTYRLGFKIVCYGKWVAQRLNREFGITPVVIPFTMDNAVYKPATHEEKAVDILFFARPSQPRRCFELGVEALRLAFKANPALRIALYGEPDYGQLGFEYHNFGLVTDPGKLAQIYRRSRVGVCFSATSPSLAAYEMLACGLPLVDLRVPDYGVNFDGERFVYYAEATPESICNAIGMALTDSKERDERIRAGLQFIDQMPADETIGRILMQAMTDTSLIMT